jgi:putative Holliday junction resolvase
MKQTSILGFDYGTHYIGVAVGQKITGTASELAVITNHRSIINWEDIEQIVNEWQPAICVVGMPLNMDGSESEMCEAVRKFARKLEGRFGVKTQLQDERLTSQEAKSLEANSPKENKERNYRDDPVDSIAARIILQSWLDALPADQ